MRRTHAFRITTVHGPPNVAIKEKNLLEDKMKCLAFNQIYKANDKNKSSVNLSRITRFLWGDPQLQAKRDTRPKPKIHLEQWKGQSNYEQTWHLLQWRVGHPFRYPHHAHTFVFTLRSLPFVVIQQCQSSHASLLSLREFLCAYSQIRGSCSRGVDCPQQCTRSPAISSFTSLWRWPEH